MTPLDMIVSFLISVVAGNLPTIKEILSKNKSVEKALKKCFKRAVEKWDVIEELKENAHENPGKFFSDLKEHLTHSPKGRHPKRNELLIHWANEIKNDPTASAFVTQIQQDLDLAISQDIKNIVTSINQNQQYLRTEIQKVQQLIDPFRADGVKSINEYWDNWAIGDNFILHSDLVLAERTEQISEVVKSAFIPGVHCMRASSISEAIAFVCASLLLSNEDSFRNAYVITKESTYERIMATEPSRLIIITDLNLNHNVAAHNGNIIFHCKLKNGNGLPELSPDAFAKSIEKSLSKNVEAHHLAKQGGYDVVSLRRILKIESKNPSWLTHQNVETITNMCLLGGWNESSSGDKEIIETFTNQKYDDFIGQVSLLLKVDNAPVIKIGSEWKVKSPIDLFSLILNNISDKHIKKLKELISYLSVDTDPEALEKIEETQIRFYPNNQMISNALKRGIYSNLAILSNIFDYDDSDKSEKIKKIVADELSSYDLKQYISNRHFIIYLAAANPKAFLNFIINDIQKGGVLLDALFKGRKKEISLTGWEINYTELIHALECIALDKCFLYEVTYILFYAMRFPKVDNYVDSVRDLLGKIYQLGYPQTEASLPERLYILNQLKDTHPKEVFWVLCHMIDSITEHHTFFFSQGFPTQIYRRKKGEDNVCVRDLNNILSFIPEVYSSTEDNYLKCLNIAMRRKLINLTSPLVDFLKKESANFKKNVKIIDEIEKEISRHERYKDADWALREDELLPFRNISTILCSDDKLLLCRKLFSKKLPLSSATHNHINYLECREKTNILRGEKILSIENDFGIETIWDYVKTVENPQAIFEGLTTLDSTKYSKVVYNAFVSGKIEDSHALIYFSRIYNQIGEIQYLNMIDELILLNKSK